ncbi:MAG TPA: FKBP-type peptidyl-prolyl cis-trans isomerase [Thermoanaerobaculia bacterium]|nr:FKBP-type peptidyl-prolyl cis-trans isomerase [Thermoanaerobaculia bacterium]
MSKRLSLLCAILALPLLAADKPAPPADLKTPPAELERVLAPGTGKEYAGADDIVRVRYTVWKEDGSLVQHVPPPQSLVIAREKMIPGWSASVSKMVTGEQRRVWIPAGFPGNKSDLGLVIDTELLEIIHRPQTPDDVAAPPADATNTESGLAYKVLQAGSGDRKPSRGSTVSVHYSGWTTDGQMFDSSVLRGTPSEFPLTAVIKGWTEGLQLMQTGEKTRFWIPANLAYGNDKSKPQGMLVFDVELIAIR